MLRVRGCVLGYCKSLAAGSVAVWLVLGLESGDCLRERGEIAIYDFEHALDLDVEVLVCDEVAQSGASLMSWRRSCSARLIAVSRG